jgi:ribonucleoside-diphosphate reductase subunit M2
VVVNPVAKALGAWVCEGDVCKYKSEPGVAAPEQPVLQITPLANADTLIDPIATNAPTCDQMASSVRWHTKAVIDVTSDQFETELAIAIAKRMGIGISTHGTFDKRNIQGVSDIDASNYITHAQEIVSSVANRLMHITCMRGRRHNLWTDPDEPLTFPDVERYALDDIPDPDVMEMVRKQEASVWFSSEIDLASDRFEDLTKDEQHFISHTLAFFSAADGIVGENLANNTIKAITDSTMRQFLSFQEGMEGIHSETYSLLLKQYVPDKAKRDHLRRAITTLPAVQAKAEWAIEWSKQCHTFAERLVAFACVEGIHFSGSFCAIFWLKKRGMMPGLTFSNELISRDEGMHCDFACLIFSKLANPCSHERIHTIVKSAVDIEIDFVCESLPTDLIGINRNMMSLYIRFVANRLCHALGAPFLYGTDEAYNPFDWMELISLQGKTNFFERRVGEYQKSGVMDSLSQERGNVFDLEVDF